VPINRWRDLAEKRFHAALDLAEVGTPLRLEFRRASQLCFCWPSGARGGRAPLLFELYGREITQGRV
jgi:hypothetical protein